MHNRPFAKLSDTELVKKRGQIKGVVMGISIVYLFSLAVVIYISFMKGFTKNSIGMFLPLLAVPMTLLPSIQNIKKLDQEIKFRQLS